VFPMGKNSSGSSSRHAARCRQSMRWIHSSAPRGYRAEPTANITAGRALGTIDSANPRRWAPMRASSSCPRLQRQASHPCARFHKGYDPSKCNVLRVLSLCVGGIVDPSRNVMDVGGDGGAGGREGVLR
jgi:hypothetical protein